MWTVAVFASLTSSSLLSSSVLLYFPHTHFCLQRALVFHTSNSLHKSVATHFLSLVLHPELHMSYSIRWKKWGVYEQVTGNHVRYHRRSLSMRQLMLLHPYIFIRLVILTP